ncbi:hypothetical protein GBAR_LOCUS8090 [Geodia barretti]|uniref:Uncharacterized protein n=1 Tax=Geodia barretti TaxID=519541 RepID=A0AA35RL85_GEOBA|nr:hypothetical protein GBAR_LOCUS8090 [Geodia barretti]
MTMTNVIAGFRTAGVYPLNRLAVAGKSKTACESLAEKTGLKFIPLYSPSHRRTQAVRTGTTFEPEEMTLFQTRFEEGYDLGDERYESWLRMYHPEVRANQDDECTPEPSLSDSLPKTSTPVSGNIMPRSSFLSRVLADQAPSIKYPDKVPGSKGGARVLTSSENLEHLNQKERKKEEAASEKQRRKEERERKKFLLQEEKEKKKLERERKKMQREAQMEKARGSKSSVVGTSRSGQYSAELQAQENVGDQSRSGPDQEELQAQENVGRQSGSDGKGDVEELSIPETRSRARTQTGLFVCIELFCVYTLVPQVLVHFNPLQWDVAEGGTSLEFKLVEVGQIQQSCKPQRMLVVSLALLGKEMLRGGPYLELAAVQENSLYQQVLVEHFNPLQWDVAEGGTSLEFKLVVSLVLMGKEMLWSGAYLELAAVLVELVHFNSLQWDVAKRGASLEFKLVISRKVGQIQQSCKSKRMLMISLEVGRILKSC